MSFEDALRIAISEDWLDARARGRLSEFAELLDYLRSFEAASLRDLVEAIVERSGLISALEAERTDEAAQRADNIREFFGVVQEFSEAHPDAGLPEFLEWLALRTDLDTLVEGESAVTMMTVHTAKGLEFPVVFIVGLEESIFPHANSMFDPVGLEEERRLMYVAITRARQRLYLAYAHSRSIYGSTQHNPASRFLTEMPEETLEKTGVGSMGLSGTGYEKRGDRRGSFGVGAVERRRARVRQRPRRARGTRRAVGGAPVLRWARAAAAGLRARSHRSAADTFGVGDVVDHKTFGQGRVVEVNGDQLTVKFARSGDTKKLLLGYAPIVKIKQ